LFKKAGAAVIQDDTPPLTGNPRIQERGSLLHGQALDNLQTPV